MTAADLTFAAARHEYRTPDGRLVPSVTQVLRATGVSADYGALDQLAPESLAYRRDLGTALHADSHSFDDGDLNVAAVDPRVRPYLDAWITCRVNLGLVPLTRERIVYDPMLGVCGTLDGLFAGRRSLGPILIDLTIGDPEAAAKRYQTAGYQLLWRANNEGGMIAERWAVELTPDRAVPYRVHPYSDWRDEAVFRAICTTYFAQYARRGKS